MTPLHREHFQRRKHENKLHTDAEAESRRTTGCVQNNESGFPWLSRTFLCAFFSNFHDHLCPFSSTV